MVSAVGLRASVVLPTHGRRASLLRVLRALDRQDVTPGAFEVVVVCDGDIDGSAAACRALAPELSYSLRVVEQDNAGPAAARNAGVAAAAAPLIVFIDDDVVPDPSFLSAHLAAQRGQETRVTIGPLLPPTDQRLSVWSAWEETALCRQYEAMTAGYWEPTYRQFYTGNASVLKRHILSAGGFDVSFKRAEDVELAHRLRERGLHFVFLAEARGWHYIGRSLESWLRIPGAYGAADVAMARAGRPWILGIVADEYRQRGPLQRKVVMLCAGRAFRARAVKALLRRAIQGAELIHSIKAGTLACSVLFNLLYYDGLSTALGGREAFEALICGQEPATLLRYVPAQGAVEAP